MVDTKKAAMTLLYPIGSFFPSQTGGPNNSLYWMTKALIKYGRIKVIVVTSNEGQDKIKIEFNKWLETDYGNVIYNTERIHYLPLKLIFRALKNTLKADAIHLTSIFYPPSWITATWAILNNRKVIWSPRGELDPKALVYSPNQKRVVLWFINKMLAKKVTFHVTCHAEELYVKEQFGQGIQVVTLPNFMEVPELMNKKKTNTFLYIGRIHPKKAIENLIKALKNSKEFLGSNFLFKIAGNYNNDYGQELIKLVNELELTEKIQFLGHIDGPQKQELLASAYFSFMPSHTENFGNVVVEALAQKTPVVASTGTPWGILEKRKAGFWINNSVDNLTKIIDKILNLQESDYNSMSDAAYNLALDEFDISKNVDKWVKVYQKILHES